MATKNNNKPCPCGSGEKAKKCRQLHEEDLVEAYEMNRRFDERNPPQPNRRLVLAALTAISSGLHSSF